AAVLVALVPWLERDEHHRVRLTLTEETEAADERSARDARARAVELEDLIDRLLGAVDRRTRPRLHDREQHALILVRHEAARHANEEHSRRGREHGESDERHGGPCEQPTDRGLL